MKCSEAKKLALNQGLTGEQLNLLRIHAEECGKCSLELEGVFLGLSLEESPQESPPSSFANVVMEQIGTTPVRGGLSSRQVVASACFLIAVGSLGYLIQRALIGLVGWLLGASNLEISLKIIMSAMDKAFDWGRTWLIVMIELFRNIYGFNNASLPAAGMIAVALLTILLFPKIIKSRYKEN